MFVEREQAAGAQHDLGDRVALDQLGRPRRQIAGVDHPLDRLHRDLGLAGVELQGIAVAHRQRLAAEPEQAAAEHVALDRRVVGMGCDLAALDEDLLIERDPDRLPGLGRARLLGHAPGLDRPDLGGLVGGREQQRVADREPAGFDSPDQDPALVELVDVLDRQAQRPVGLARLGQELIERLDHGRPLVPGHDLGAGDDVVALARRDRDEAQRLDPEPGQIGAILLGDRAEAVGAVTDQVHLVDQDRDLAHAQKVEQIAVPVGLLAHALLGVDQQERGLAAGRAGDHVLEEFLVAGRIDDDVVAGLGAELDLGGVDGHPLVALGLERVHQEGPFERHAAPRADRLDRLELALRQRARVVEQAADQGRLAVIDVADDHDPKLGAGAVRGHRARPHI